MEATENNRNFMRFMNMSEKEILKQLTDEEREYLINDTKTTMPRKEFDSLTEDMLNREIVLNILIDIALNKFEDFHCLISKKHADALRLFAAFHKMDLSNALEFIIDKNCAEFKKEED